MLLVFDRGNTTDKFVVFEGDNIVFNSSEEILTFTEIKCDVNKFFLDISRFFSEKNFHIRYCIFSSVRNQQDNASFISAASQFYKIEQINIQMSLPIINLYKSQNLGMDRLAAIIGANKLFGNNVLVIDAGTCLTFDYLDTNNRYLGGSISPGFRIKYEALYNFTANLPLINSVDEIDLVGNSTDSCIKSGVINGTIAEIEQMISLYKKRFPGVNIILTGGDSSFIKSKLTTNIIEEKNLVFWGLKNIYEFNEKNHK
ncbi:MAG: type III pantothenate kinase [Bacteroidales bacterium]